MHAPTSITLPCYAKINLALAVGPPETMTSAKPGFHPICSWFACVDLRDDLTVRRAGTGSTYEIAWAADARRASPIDWPIEKDLCVRAHRALEARVGRGLPVALTLHKRIPVGGGLGGGSSNAASTLRAVNELYELALSSDELHALAMTLGSDVSFFLDLEGPVEQAPRPALVEGFGERLRRVAPVPAGIVLIFPPFGCPTGAVYREFDSAPAAFLDAARVAALVAESQRATRIDATTLFNDLAGPAERVAPGLGALRGILADAVGRPVHITGSGSTMFVLTASDGEDAELIAQKVRAARPDVACIATRLV